AEALRRNTLGLRLGEIHPELSDYQPAELLPAKPLRSIRVRHTVGLTDPLTEADILPFERRKDLIPTPDTQHSIPQNAGIPPAERLDDGLPQSLEACIAAYGLTHFKIKLCGELERDTDRLLRIARLLEATGSQYAFTLDGNEQYHAV